MARIYHLAFAHYFCRPPVGRWLHGGEGAGLEVLLEDGEGTIRSVYWPEIVDLARTCLSWPGEIWAYYGKLF